MTGVPSLPSGCRGTTCALKDLSELEPSLVDRQVGQLRLEIDVLAPAAAVGFSEFQPELSRGWGSEDLESDRDGFHTTGAEKVEEHGLDSRSLVSKLHEREAGVEIGIIGEEQNDRGDKLARKDVLCVEPSNFKLTKTLRLDVGCELARGKRVDNHLGTATRRSDILEENAQALKNLWLPWRRA